MADVLTPKAQFEAIYTELMDRLSATGATLVVANIPDVATIPYVQPVRTLAYLLGVPDALFAGALGISMDDSVNLDGIADIVQMLHQTKSPPLDGRFVLTPADIVFQWDVTTPENQLMHTGNVEGAWSPVTGGVTIAGDKHEYHVPAANAGTAFINLVFVKPTGAAALPGISPAAVPQNLPAQALPPAPLGRRLPGFENAPSAGGH